MIIAAPPINDALALDKTGRITSPAWIAWLSQVADLTVEATLSDVPPVQSSIVTGTSISAPDPIVDVPFENNGMFLQQNQIQSNIDASNDFLTLYWAGV